MTFKDLRKRVSLESTYKQQNIFFDKLDHKPFWIWDTRQYKLEDVMTSGDCCFNHIIGLPQKDGMDKPLYDYEKIIFDPLAVKASSSSDNRRCSMVQKKGLLLAI